MRDIPWIGQRSALRAIPTHARLTGLLAVLLGGMAMAPLAVAAESRGTFGMNVANRLGVGMVTPQTPLGLRYFWDRRAGMEVGFGFSSRSGGANTFTLDGGGFLALAPGDRTNFFFAPACAT